MQVKMNRILAYIYDVILQGFLILGIYLLSKYVISRYLTTVLQEQLIRIGLILLGLVIYFAIIPSKLKGTIGKYMADLEVISTKGKFTFGRWLFRELIFKNAYIYLGIIIYSFIDKLEMTYLYIYLGIGFFIELLFIIIKRTTIHDYFLKTKVISRELSE